jgi:D-beta-D-heptose 7-phosphate kinase/D-beta-D-heptose 1-phosphate adenosyltransferase
MCNGCFDGLHPGHMFFLGFCRGQGDRLVVGINSDEYIRSKKGREPVPYAERAAALRAIGCIEAVVIFEECNPSVFIRSVHPDVHCIGEEYRDTAAELETCRELGIDVVYVPRVGKWSTTGLRGGHGKERP